jgi:hypothetical protein
MLKQTLPSQGLCVYQVAGLAGGWRDHYHPRDGAAIISGSGWGRATYIGAAPIPYQTGLTKM